MAITKIPPRTGNFHRDNAYSLRASEELFWEAVYEKAFPGLKYSQLCKDLAQQKQGVDRVLYFMNGNIQYVDEKKRTKDYGDILLEHTSNVERGTPGWMEKDLAIDYLAYAIMPLQRCYLFPWPMLRRAWLQYRDKWRKEYWDTVPGTTEIGNGEIYHTHSVAIPLKVLQRAVTTAAIIDVSDWFGEL